MQRFVFIGLLLALAPACEDTSTAETITGTSQPDDGGTQEDAMVQPDAAQNEARLVINEVVASPAEGGVDWVEFFVIGDGTVVPSEYTFIDNDDTHPPVRLSGQELSGGDFLVIYRGDEDDQFDFGLGRSDTVRLFHGNNLVDLITWTDTDAAEGASFGRFPDGEGDWQATRPTPGTNNRTPDQSEEPSNLFPQDRVMVAELILSAQSWAAIRNDPLAEEYHDGDIVLDGTRVTNVAIRVKGNSSLNSVARSSSFRYSFKVDMNRNVSGQTLRGVKKLNFNNGFKDPSFMREHLGYGLVRRAGVPGSRTAFVDLTVAGEHLGLYTIVEQVDDEFLTRNFGNSDGDLYKPEPQAGFLRYEGPDIESYRLIGIENNEDTTDHSAFLNFISVLHGITEGRLEDILDVDGVLLNLALNSVMVNLDSYLGMGHNYYLYEQNGVFVDIHWDLNETYGNFTCRCDRDGLINLRIDEPTCGPLAERPLVEIPLADEDYRARYYAHLTELVDGPGSIETMVGIINTTAELIRPYVERDPTKFFTTEDFERSLRADISGGRGGGGWGLESFIRDRNDAIKRQLNGANPSGNNGLGSCQGFSGGMNQGSAPGEANGCPPCGDGVCDNFEANNPDVCPVTASSLQKAATGVEMESAMRWRTVSAPVQ